MKTDARRIADAENGNRVSRIFVWLAEVLSPKLTEKQAEVLKTIKFPCC